MKEAVLKIIEDLYNEKANSTVRPVLVLDIELHNRIKTEVVSIIRELWKEKKVDVGRTANHNFVEIRTLESPRRNRKIILHEIK